MTSIEATSLRLFLLLALRNFDKGNVSMAIQQLDESIRLLDVSQKGADLNGYEEAR